VKKEGKDKSDRGLDFSLSSSTELSGQWTVERVTVDSPRVSSGVRSEKGRWRKSSRDLFRKRLNFGTGPSGRP